MDGTAVGALDRGRDAYARRAWLEAHEAFSRADDDGALEAEDLELLAMAKLMLGRDDESIAILERAHHRYLERGETQRAVRAATWIGMNLGFRGAIAPANGWLGRAQRLLDRQPGDSVEHGYLMIPAVFRLEAGGDFEAAAALAGEAAAVAERFGDRDLLSMSLNAQGTMLVRAGRVRDGFGLLDEAMVTATTSDLTPFVLGIVYCGVILACQEVFEVGRAREWTLALSTWADEQPDLVAFTGRCRIHRAEILQLGGSWSDALEEAGSACRRMIETQNAAAGIAYYRRAELLRLRGEFAAAEEAYREASSFGWEPQPGPRPAPFGPGEP
jgi:tetratricopeptide (TPR) repeat protein